jgi:hypothetical protein
VWKPLTKSTCAGPCRWSAAIHVCLFTQLQLESAHESITQCAFVQTGCRNLNALQDSTAYIICALAVDEHGNIQTEVTGSLFETLDGTPPAVRIFAIAQRSLQLTDLEKSSSGRSHLSHHLCCACCMRTPSHPIITVQFEYC